MYICFIQLPIFSHAIALTQKIQPNQDGIKLN